ncbi:MAG: SPOR domain-containing protein [bacterium]
MKKILLLIFILITLVSIFVFVQQKGYESIITSFTNEEEVKIDTIKVDSLDVSKKYEIYRVIVGSFQEKENANNFSNSFDFSDILEMTTDSFYRVSKDYYFNYDDALNDLKEYKFSGRNAWILKDSIEISK